MPVFNGIARETELDVRQVRRDCRALARAGLAEYTRGLFSAYTGMVSGSGYGCTPAGKTFIEAEDGGGAWWIGSAGHESRRL